MSEEQRRQLQQQLWKIADSLRGKMHADEFRDYMLGFIFYKYLSEKIDKFANKILEPDERLFTSLDENNADDAEMIESVKKATVKELGYFLKPSELFHAIASKGNNKQEGEGSNFIISDLTRIFKNIEQSTQGTDSADEFVNLFEDLDLTSSKLGNSEKAKNELITKVMSHLDQIDFQLQDVNADVLGDAYEYLIGEFASGAGKKAGEFYTPQPVSTLLAKLVTCQNKKLKNVYDPTCGSGSLLLRVKKEATNDYKLRIYGQELNRTTFNLARMNMILHDVHYADFDLRQEDTLEHPQHRDLRFDAIVANPPFSAHWSANPLFMSDDRFGVYGRLAPGTKADMAFVQHMIYQLADDGVMACVLPHGVLFRGAAEGHIRKYFIEQLNYLDAVIGLPANIFYGTSIPTCVLVFKKCRKNPDDILFIDASQHFEKVKTQNRLLPEHINNIVNAYLKRKNQPKYSHVASLADIKANDYNLNIPRYVDTFEAEEAIDLGIVTENLKLLYEKSQEADEIIFSFCKELNIPTPKGNNVFWLTQYKKGVMQQIFSQQLRFKDDDGREFPEWEEKSLEDVSEYLQSGKSKYKNESGDFILYGSTGTIGFCNQFDYQGKNILIARVGANAGYLYEVDGNYCVSDNTLILHLKDQNNYSFFYNLLKYTNLNKLVFGSGQPLITGGQLKALNIFVPSFSEQTKIANFLIALDDKINYNQTQLDAVKNYKQGLFQKLLV